MMKNSTSLKAFFLMLLIAVIFSQVLEHQTINPQTSLKSQPLNKQNNNLEINTQIVNSTNKDQKSIFDHIKDTTIQIADTISDKTAQISKEVSDKAKQLSDNLPDSASIWQSIINFFTSIWKSIVNFFSSIWQSISKFFSSIWKGITDFGEWISDHMQQIILVILIIAGSVALCAFCINGAGFTAAGIAAKSIAAFIHSCIGIVGKGTLFALTQSFAASGWVGVIGCIALFIAIITGIILLLT